MAYTPNSPILTTDPQLLDTQALAAYVNRLGGDRVTETREYVDAVVSGALRLGIDPVVILAQWWLETDAGRSTWWVKNLNPAGLGITGDREQNAVSQRWATGTAAAYGHLAHMAAYLWGDDAIDHWPDTWPDLADADHRFGAPVRAGYHADTLEDLNGTWAIDPQNDYGGKLVNRANAIVLDYGQGEPMTELTFGNVPKPPSVNRHIPSSQNMAWDDLGTRANPPDALVWHRMIGTLRGTDEYFRGFANARRTKRGALTNIGIGVKATDGAALAGVIYEWNIPENDTENRAGWANGTVNNPYGDGKKYLDLFGIDAVNRDPESMEISGDYDTPLDAKSREAIIAWSAWRADQYGAWLAERGEQFDYTTFPIIPSQNNRSFVCWHQEFTIGTGKICPGQVVIGETSALLAAIRNRLQDYQTMPAPPPEPPDYATPQPVEPGTRVINNRLYLGVTETYTLARDVTPRLWADPSSPATGPDLKAGTTVKVAHVVKDEGIESALTLELVDGSRIPASVVQGGT